MGKVSRDHSRPVCEAEASTERVRTVTLLDRDWRSMMAASIWSAAKQSMKKS